MSDEKRLGIINEMYGKFVSDEIPVEIQVELVKAATERFERNKGSMDYSTCLTSAFKAYIKTIDALRRGTL